MCGGGGMAARRARREVLHKALVRDTRVAQHAREEEARRSAHIVEPLLVASAMLTSPPLGWKRRRRRMCHAASLV
jgi:hypothetical protein